MEEAIGTRPLVASTVSSTVVLLVLSGKVDTPERISELDLDIKKAHLLICDLCTKAHSPIDILFDLHAFSGIYSPLAIESLAHLAKEDEQYVRKTACFGASETIRLAGDIIAVIAGRGNIHFFKDEEEARAWLTEK